MFDSAPDPAVDGHTRPTEQAADAHNLDSLEDELTELSAHLNAAEHRFLVLLERFDRHRRHLGTGLKSTAHWLNWKCGIALGAARERVRVARALPDVPLIAEAMARGELSYSKVRALTRVATPHNQDYLLMIAHHGTTSHLERLIRGYRRAQRAEEADQANRQYKTRELRYWYDDDGTLVIHGRLPPDQGALVVKALEAARDGLPTTQDPAQAEPGLLALQADALTRIAETTLAHEPAAMPAGERYQVVVHVDADTLPTDGDGLRSHLEDGPRVSAEASRRISCDCSIVPVLANAEGDILNIGRKSRQIPPAIRRALHLRDKGCRFPGCTEHRYVDGHHIQHWADGGHTSLENLVLLCRHHHRLVHEGGFDVTRVGKRLRFTDPAGHTLPPAPQITLPAGTADTPLRGAHQQAGLTITPNTPVPDWQGERMDLPWAVEGLIRRAHVTSPSRA